MIQSMTGFGKGVASSSGKKITVEIKSINSKQLDLTLRVPAYFRELEMPARNEISPRLERGKVELCTAVESILSDHPSVVNTEVLRCYKQQIEEVAATLHIDTPDDWFSVLMRMPDAMKTEVTKLDRSDTEAFHNAVKEAVDALCESRLLEGRRLYGFFIEKIRNISELLDSIDPFENERVAKVKARLVEQLSRMDSIEYDAGRLEQEMIFYIEKLDVNEEKQRLRSHLNYFLETVGGEGDNDLPQQGQGKKLGFIAQEMGREINTLGSKSNHAEMQKIVVKMKDELEQIKEQVLNVL